MLAFCKWFFNFVQQNMTELKVKFHILNAIDIVDSPLRVVTHYIMQVPILLLYYPCSSSWLYFCYNQ